MTIRRERNRTKVTRSCRWGVLGRGLAIAVAACALGGVGISFASTQASTAVRARALQILFRAGCVAPDPAVLDSAESILALAERKGTDGVREALGCTGTAARDDAAHARPALHARVVEAPSPPPVVAAEDDTGDTPEPAAATVPAKTETPDPKATPNQGSALFGTSVKTDYTAKNFALVAGAAVLNRFKLSPSPTATPSGPVTSYTLDGGSTVARAFLEGNVRYRWAWQDRLSLQQGAATSALADPSVQMAAARRDAAAKVLAAAVEADAVASTDASRAKVGRARRDKEDAEAAYTTALATAYDQRVQGAKSAWQKFNAETPVTGILACMETGGWAADQPECVVSQLIPQDWQARLGYVFDSGSSTTAGVPAASDLYGQLALGWNLVRWTFPTASFSDTPLRGAINFEPAISMVSDSSFNDVHEQYFVGASASIGVPIRWTSSPPPRTIGQIAALENSGRDGVVADPVVEFLARLGATRVDVPEFVEQGTAAAASSRLVKARHGQPDFRGQWGLGFDLELNVPVPNNLGYVVARGIFDAELDPDPWALQIGYTIPISNLISGLGASTQ